MIYENEITKSVFSLMLTKLLILATVVLAKQT